MRRATESFRKDHWPENDAIASVTLDFDGRYRRRHRIICGDGLPVLIDFVHAVVLRDGDGLQLVGGGWIGVVAAPEELTEIRCDSAALLTRVAWHLGNRHCPVEIDGDRLFIRRDRIIEAMVASLGTEITQVERPFNPEGGAYAGVHSHG